MTNGEKFKKVFRCSVDALIYIPGWEDEEYNGPEQQDSLKPLMDYTLSELYHELFDEMNERSQ